MNDNKLIVRYYADSLGLPRKDEVGVNDRYISKLNQFWKNKFEIEFLDRARANSTIGDLSKWFVEDNRYYGSSADIIILHEGVVDCAPRPIPNKIRKIISTLPKFIKNRVISFLHNNRSKMQKIGIKYYLTKPNDFYFRYKEMVSEMIKISRRVYIINIAPTNEMIEKHSPGFSKSISEYNEIIRKISKEINSNNLFLIDINSIILQSSYNLNQLVFEHDGHHITPLCHKIIADKIIEHETEFVKIKHN